MQKFVWESDSILWKCSVQKGKKVKCKNLCWSRIPFFGSVLCKKEKSEVQKFVLESDSILWKCSVQKGKKCSARVSVGFRNPSPKKCFVQ